MAGLPRIIRGMIGTGLTFAAGVGVAAGIVGSIVVLVGGGSYFEMFQMAGKLAVVAGLLGIGFSGLVAISARSRRLAELSIPRFASLGAGAGLLYFLFLAMNARGHWSLADALGNLAILTLVGGGSATGTLIMARRGRAELESGEEQRALGER